MARAERPDSLTAHPHPGLELILSAVTPRFSSWNHPVKSFRGFEGNSLEIPGAWEVH